MIKTLKKISKKSLAILIALLMIIPVMPFTPPISVEAATDTSALKNAISAYENKMNGTIYTNMKDAYDKYILACEAYDAITYGERTGIDVNTVASNLSNATTAMTAFSDPVFNTTAYFYKSSMPATDGYSNVVYQSSNPYTAFGYQGSDAWHQTGKINFKMAIPYEIVLVNDGANDVYSPIVVQATNKDSDPLEHNQDKYKRLRYVSLSSDSSTGYTKLELKQNWNMEKVDCTWKSPLSNKNPVPYISSETDHSINFASVRDENNYTLTNRLYFKSVTTDGNTKDYYDKFSGEQIKLTIAAHKHSKGLFSSEDAVEKNNYYAYGTQSGAQYVINYKPIKTKLSSAKTNLTNALKGKTVSSYKEGGLGSLLDLIDKCTADNVDPTKYTYSSGVETAVTTCANNIKKVNAISVPNVTEDSNQANYNSLKTEIVDYNTIIANNTYKNHPLSDYTDDSIAKATTALNEAKDFMKNVYTNGYADPSTATSKYNAMVTAKEGLTLKSYKVTFKYADDSVADEKVYTIGTLASNITKPNNTASNYDNAKHYSYSWPDLANVTADATYKELKSEAKHSFTPTVTKNPDCTTAGVTKYTCACGYSYTDDTTPAATGHTEVIDEAVEPTCTKTGLTQGKHCSVCNTVLVAQTEIPALGHDYTYNSIDSVSHSVICSRNCNEEGWSYTEKHNIKNGECTKCDYVEKVTITFVDENDGVIRSDIYNIGADVVVPDLPEQTEVYVGDSQHKVTTYSWNEIPQATASQAATYQIVKTESTVACSNELMQKYETYDTWHCTVCLHEYNRDVTDMSALKANIKALETAINVDDAAYKYDATALADAKETLDEAKAYVANDNNRYASIQDVNAMSTDVGTAYTKLTVDGLAKYSQTFIIRKDDGKGNTTDLKKFTVGYENLAYGSTVEFNEYTIPTIEDESSTLNGLPMYAVYKWVKIVNGAEQKLGTTDVQISDVVKGKTTYICYVLDFKATDDTQTKTRVRYLDKSGNTIEFDTATVGEPYTRKDTSIAPIIPYYKCTGWEPLFGDETNVGTRELVYRAIYTFNETEANRCTIVGLPGVYVNGTTGTPGYKAYYDEKIELTGADKYAYANADGSIIAPINENYIFAPHLNGVDKTIYITKVETPIEDAKSIITGVFTTHEDTTYNYLVINAQYYLPEGAKAVEAGAVIGKYNNADTLKIGSAVKVVSDTQGDNHEYSLQMSYSKGKTGTLYARSYLIYVDSNGDTQTVYSDDITTCNLD